MLALAPARMIQLAPSEMRLKSSDQTTPISDSSQLGVRLATRCGLEKKPAPVPRQTRAASALLLTNNRIGHVGFAVAADREGKNGEFVAGQQVRQVGRQRSQRNPARVDAQHLIGRTALDVPKTLPIPACRSAVG